MASCRYQDGLTETQISGGTLESILPLDFRDTKRHRPTRCGAMPFWFTGASREMAPVKNAVPGVSGGTSCRSG